MENVFEATQSRHVQASCVNAQIVESGMVRAVKWLDLNTNVEYLSDGPLFKCQTGLTASYSSVITFAGACIYDARELDGIHVSQDALPNLMRSILLKCIGNLTLISDPRAYALHVRFLQSYMVGFQ